MFSGTSISIWNIPSFVVHVGIFYKILSNTHNIVMNFHWVVYITLFGEMDGVTLSRLGCI